MKLSGSLRIYAAPHVPITQHTLRADTCFEKPNLQFEVLQRFLQTSSERQRWSKFDAFASYADAYFNTCFDVPVNDANRMPLAPGSSHIRHKLNERYARVCDFPINFEKEHLFLAKLKSNDYYHSYDFIAFKISDETEFVISLNEVTLIHIQEAMSLLGAVNQGEVPSSLQPDYLNYIDKLFDLIMIRDFSKIAGKFPQLFHRSDPQWIDHIEEGAFFFKFNFDSARIYRVDQPGYLVDLLNNRAVVNIKIGTTESLKKAHLDLNLIIQMIPVGNPVQTTPKNNIDAHFNMGWLAFIERDYDRAVDYFERVLEFNEFDSEAALNKATCLFQKARQNGYFDDSELSLLEEAKVIIDSVISYDQFNEDAYKKRIEWYKTYDPMGFMDELLSDYTRLIRLNPKSAALYHALGKVYETLGRDNMQALELYAIACALSPNTLVYLRAYRNVQLRVDGEDVQRIAIFDRLFPPFLYQPFTIDERTATASQDIVHSLKHQQSQKGTPLMLEDSFPEIESEVAASTSTHATSNETLMRKIFAAAKHGDFNGLRHHLDDWRNEHPDLHNSREGNGDSLLHIAARQANQEMIRYLLDLGIHFVQNHINNTPLHEAGITGCWECVDLIDQHYPGHWEDKNDASRTVIMEAADAGHLDVVRALIEKQVNTRLKDSSGNTMWHYLAQHASVTVDDIRRIKANPTNVNSINLSPLHIAIEHNNLAFVRVLIGKAGINQLASRDVTLGQEQIKMNALHYAVYVGADRVVSHFLKQYNHLLEFSESWGNCLHIAVYADQSFIATLLYSHKPELLNEKHQGKTPFTLAAYLGRNRMIKEMVFEMSVDPDSPDAEKTALYRAVEEGRLSTVELLCELGADPVQGVTNPNQDHHRTPEMLAVILQSENPGEQYEDIHDTLQATIESKGNGRVAIVDRLEKTLPKTLVFSGGGVKGLSYGGAVLALKQHITQSGDRDWSVIDRYAGTSVGSITAMMLAVGMSPDEAMLLLCDLDMMYFIDNGIVKDGIKAHDVASSEKSITEKISEVWSIFKDYIPDIVEGASKADLSLSGLKQGISQLYQVQGLCDGGAMLEWVEGKIRHQIRLHTGRDIEWITFGEYAELVREFPNALKHVYLWATSLSTQEVMVFSSEDNRLLEECRNVPMSYAVRASASFPGLFKPLQLKYKTSAPGKKVGYELVESQSIFLVDGGLLRNYPIDYFSKKRFLSNANQIHSDYLDAPAENDAVLGFRFITEDKDFAITTVDNIKDAGLAMANIYFAAEMHSLSHSKEYYDRFSVDIDLRGIGVGTTTFNVNDTQKQNMMSQGHDAIAKFYDTSLDADSFCEDATCGADTTIPCEYVTNGVSTLTIKYPTDACDLITDHHTRGLHAMQQVFSYQIIAFAAQRIRSSSIEFSAWISMLSTLPEVWLAEDAVMSDEDGEMDIFYDPDLTVEWNGDNSEPFFLPSGSIHHESLYDALILDDTAQFHDTTGAPIFKFDAFKSGEQVGSISFYQHPLLCRSESSDRHNVYATEGIFDQVIIDTTDIEEVCASLPPTFLDDIVNAAMRGGMHGALRGAGSVVTHAAKRKGISSIKAMAMGKASYYLMYLSMSMMMKSSEAESMSWAESMRIMSASLAETGTVITMDAGFILCQLGLQWSGQQCKASGYEQTGRALMTVSDWVPYGTLAYQANRQGVVNTTASFFGGLAVSKSVECVGKGVTDMFVASSLQA